MTKTLNDKLYAISLNEITGAYEVLWNDDRLDEFTDELANKLAKEMGVINVLPDEAAVELAKRDGVKLIPPSELPITFERFYEGWIDTPENRAKIASRAEAELYECRETEFYKLMELEYKSGNETLTLDTVEAFTPEDRKKWGMEATIALAIQQFVIHGGKVIPENELPKGLPKEFAGQVYQDTPENRETLSKVASNERTKEYAVVKAKAKARAKDMER